MCRASFSTLISALGTRPIKLLGMYRVTQTTSSSFNSSSTPVSSDSTSPSSVSTPSSTILLPNQMGSRWLLFHGRSLLCWESSLGVQLVCSVVIICIWLLIIGESSLPSSLDFLALKLKGESETTVLLLKLWNLPRRFSQPYHLLISCKFSLLTPLPRALNPLQPNPN